MSNHNTPREVRETPQYEHWLGVIASSVLPPVAVFFAPASFLMPLLALSALLFVVGLVMLWKNTTPARVATEDRAAGPSRREEPSYSAMKGTE